MVGGPDLREGGLPGKVDVEVVTQQAERRHFSHYPDASVMVQRYQEQILGRGVGEESYGPADYLRVHVPIRSQRRAVARVRLGCSSWLAEDVGRTQRVPRGERPCPHCGAHLQSAHHAVFEFPLLHQWREQHTHLFLPDMTLAQFFQQEDPRGVAHFVEGCQRIAWGVEL